MITSKSNPKVKNLILLGKHSKARREQGVFLAEGRKMFEEAPEEWIRQVYVSESFLGEESNRSLLAGRPYEVLSNSLFGAVSDTKTPQGILTEVAMPRWDAKEIWSRPDACYLFLESIQDPGNLGTMLRTGEGAGVAAVIANKTTVDLYSPKTIRSTMGSIYRIPFLVAEDFGQAILEGKRRGVRFYAAHLKGSVCYDKPDYRHATGFLIGNEGNGLTPETASLADAYIRIPMEGKVESLNAAAAAAILMYEANRQRRG